MHSRRYPYSGKRPWDSSERFKAVERMRERTEEKYGDADDDGRKVYEGDPEACVGLCQYYRSRGMPNPFEENAGWSASHKGPTVRGGNLFEVLYSLRT